MDSTITSITSQVLSVFIDVDKIGVILSYMTSIISISAIVAALIQPKKDSFLGKIFKLINILGCNALKAKNK